MGYVGVFVKGGGVRCRLQLNYEMRKAGTSFLGFSQKIRNRLRAGEIEKS